MPVWKNENGKVLRSDTTGKVFRCADCPCGCADCPNSLTPARQYEVTLTGFDSRLCTGCDQCGTGVPDNPARKMNTLSLDGTYTVAYDSDLPSAEYFNNYLGAVGTHTHYSKVDCTGYNGTNNVTADIRIYCNYDNSGNQTSIDIEIIAGYELSRCNSFIVKFFEKTGLDCLGFGESHTGLTDGRTCGTDSPVSSGATVDIEVVA